MGLSASQSRFLMLTARKSNIEFEIQQTTQAKLALANEQDAAAVIWSNGMNIQHLYYDPNAVGSTTASMQRLNYQTTVRSAEEKGLGMRVIDSYGKIVVPSLPEPFPEDDDVGRYLVDPNCTQADYFEQNLNTGNWLLQEPENSDIGWRNTSVEGCEFIYKGVDADDYARSEADYSAEVERLENIDKRFDMRIQYLSNEQKAIETEMDSVKKVIDKNIEETFKTFG